MLRNLIILLKIWWEERKKEKKKTNYLFCFTMRNARFVYPRIMDGSGHMGGGDSTCGNGDYERQAMSNWVHDSTCEAAS